MAVEADEDLKQAALVILHLYLPAKAAQVEHLILPPVQVSMAVEQVAVVQEQ